MSNWNSEELAHLIKDAEVQFTQYAESQKDFQCPLAQISIETEVDETTRVFAELEFKGTHYSFESIKEKDVVIIDRYLNGQPLVRAKYAHGNTVSLKATAERVHTLVDRFENKKSPLYLYSGFIVSDAQTGTFLGFVNIGQGSGPRLAEMSRLNRIECWSHPPDVISAYADPDPRQICRKTYSGVGTAETCTLIQYATRLKQEGYRIDGHPLEALVATARVDNAGSWKSNAKAGMKLYDVNIAPSHGYQLRYYLRKNIE